MRSYYHNLLVVVGSPISFWAYASWTEREHRGPGKLQVLVLRQRSGHRDIISGEEHTARYVLQHLQHLYTGGFKSVATVCILHTPSK